MQISYCWSALLYLCFRTVSTKVAAYLYHILYIILPLTALSIGSSVCKIFFLISSSGPGRCDSWSFNESAKRAFFSIRCLSASEGSTCPISAATNTDIRHEKNLSIFPSKYPINTHEIIFIQYNVTSSFSRANFLVTDFIIVTWIIIYLLSFQG